MDRYTTAICQIVLILYCSNVLCDTTRSVPLLPLPEYDTYGNPEWFPRIVGGYPAALGDFKGIVSIQVYNSGSHFCGGTLINASFVVTAAHCLTDSETGRIASPTRVQVMGDDISIVKNSTNPRRQIRRAIQLFVHQQYSIRTLENDIAMIRVRPPFDITTTFAPVPLPTINVPLSGTCHVAGWGVTKENGTVSPHLLQVHIDIVPSTTCNRTYGGIIRDGMFCAGAMQGGRDSCQGDSGGGLICNSTLNGIVSFGKGCGRVATPGVYTNVFNYLRWIAQVMIWSENQSPPIPTTVKPTKKPSSASVNAIGISTIMLCAIFASVYSTIIFKF